MSPGNTGNIDQLLSELQGRGVRLWHDDNRLHYRAPKGALSPELLDELRQRKDEVTRFLAAASRAVRVDTPDQATSSVRTDEGAPLSFAQERLWFLHQLEGGGSGGPGSAYNVPAALRLTGPLDPQALEQSLTEIVRRHAILRTRIVMRDEHAWQLAAPSSPVVVPIVDLTAVPSGQRDVEARRRIDEEAAHGFDLSAGPLFRFRLLRLAPDEHIFVAVLHHMVTDGWSMSVLMRELRVLYDAYARRATSPLADLPLQYADHAVRERQIFSGSALDADLAYWKQRLESAPPVLELPADRPRPAEQSYRGGLVRFALDAEQTRLLKQCAQRHDATVFMVLLAAYATFLHRYTEQTDLVVGTPVANRDRREIEDLIGVFSNYVPLRVDLSGDPAFGELVGRVRALMLETYAHQHVPFEKLVEVLRPERTLSVAPLFQVALVLQNLPTDAAARPFAGLPGIDVQPIQIDRATAKLDLSILLEETGDTIQGELEYSADLFDRDTAERMAAHLGAVMASASAGAGQRISTVALLSGEERRRVLTTWSGIASRTNEAGGVVHERFEAQVAARPNDVAIVYGEERLTYAEVNARADRLAHRLMAAGAGPESRVGVCLPRSVDLIVTLLAVLKAGAAYVPLDGSHPRERLAAIVAAAGIDVVVTNEAFTPRLPSGATLINGGSEEQDPPYIVTSRLAPRTSHLAYVIYTSGSTGRPKGVMVDHRSVCSLVAALDERVYAHHPGALHVALVAPVVFDASVQQIFGALLLGHTLHVVDEESRRDGGRLCGYLREHAIDVADCTPSLLALMLDAGLGADQSLPLRHLLVGGEALPAALLDTLRRQDAGRQIAVTNLYGPTECGVDNVAFTVKSHVSSLKSAQPPGPGTLETSDVRLPVVPIGTPLSNSHAFILDGRGEPVPIGVPGDIWIGGPCLGRGYLGDPVLTALAYRPHPFATGERLYFTGDRGRWDAAGVIAFLGRSDGQVKVRGHRIELGEVEAALRRHPRVVDALAHVEATAAGHHELVAFIVPAAAAPTVADLRSHLDDTLPAYMIPSAFRMLSRFPLNASGKVDRAAVVRERTVTELDRGVRYVAPRDERERALAAVWSALLDREPIGTEDHFFALGGDSIKALQVAARLRQIGLRLDIRDLFIHPTLGGLAPHLVPLVAARIREEAGGGGRDVPLGPAQTWFLREYPGAKDHFQHALVLRARGPLDQDALQQAMRAIVEHHPALRMRFRVDEGRWIQEDGGIDRASSVELVDLRNASDPHQALRSHAAALQVSIRLEDGSLFRVVLYRFPAAADRLLLVAHHLVVDGVSWRILLEDLELGYRQALAGERPKLPARSQPFGQWADDVRAFAKTHAAAGSAERVYWAGVEHAEVRPFAVDAPDAIARQRDRAECRLLLSAEETRALLTDAHQAYGTRIDDLLLTALARAVSGWTGDSRTLVLLESHGREPLEPVAPVAPVENDSDVSRTVGWFTARYPVVLELGGAADLGRHIKLVKETLRRVPHGGVGYEALRYLTGAPASETERRLQPQIAFNYLGQLGRELRSDLWEWVDEDAGPSIDPDAPLLQELEIIGMVAGERLQVAMGYSRRRFREATVRALAAALHSQLVDVISHTCDRRDRELTPSDLDYDGFDVDGLARFIDNL